VHHGIKLVIALYKLLYSFVTRMSILLHFKCLFVFCLSSLGTWKERHCFEHRSSERWGVNSSLLFNLRVKFPLHHIITTHTFPDKKHQNEFTYINYCKKYRNFFL